MKSRRLLRVELFEQRMMLHGDAVDGHDTMTDMDDLSMAADMAGMTADSMTATHDHTSLTEIPEGVAVPTISISATNDYYGGVNVAVQLSDFKIVETDSTDVVIGEGHMHIYLDGEKVTRFYDLSYKLANVEPGLHTIEVGLNANDHSAYAVGGKAISASTSIVVAEAFSAAALGAEGEAITAGNIIISGASAGSLAGTSIASAGDVNGDGIEDMIVGAPGVNSSAGAAYVVFGSLETLASAIDLSTLSAANGLTLVGGAGERAGVSVSSAGDVNNDGFDDLLIGASSADPSSRADAGAAYVVFGGASLPGSITLSALDGTNGFRLNGATAGDVAGASVAGIGDFNNDGFDDVLIGVSGADPSGRTDAGSAYVVYGASSFSATIELSSLTGTSGFRLDGAAAGDEFGFSVAAAGDLDSDGFRDLIVGAPGADPNEESEAGSAYVIFGASSFASTDVSTLSGTNGFRVDGVNENDRAGFAVAGDGDANGDGFDDVIIGAPRAEVAGVSVGAAYVILGKSSDFTASVSLDALDGTDGFRLAGDYASDPLLSSFIINLTGRTAHEVTGQNTSLVVDALVNFTSVVPDANSVYATTSGISYQVIGPFPGNPGTVTDQDRTHVIPRDPVEETGEKVSTGLGSTGVWIDGVAVYNWSDGMSYNNGGVWNQNAVYWEGNGLDANGGHPPPTGEYHTHTVNIGLMTDLGDDGSSHSPLLGWSYDGFPIYGPWGYSGTDGTGEVVKLDSSWQTRNITERTHLGDGTDVADGPTVAEVPLGAYVEDYEYVAGLGDLDEYNGIFSVTPEYPDGIYHYVVTIDDTETISVGSGVFPYVIGLEYYGEVEEANLTGGGGPPPDGGPPPVGGTPPAVVVPIPDPGVISVSIPGDLNGDGIDDIAVGDPDACVPGSGVAGTVNVVHGQSNFPADTSLSGAADYTGENAGDQTGYAVGGVDLNGDGAADLLVGSPGSNSSTGSVSIVMGTISVTNDAALVFTESGGTTIVSESGTTDTIGVAIASQPTADVTIAVNSSNTGEVTVSPGTLTFTSANWNVVQTVTVTGVADGIVDADKTINIVFDPSSSDTGYNALVNSVVFAGNQNIDVANVAPTADAGGPYTGQVGSTVSLTAAGSSDSDGAIANYAWDLDNDGQYDDATGVTTSFAATTAGTFTIGVQVTDDDGATSADTATVTVSAAAATPGLVVIQSGGSTSVNENGTSDTVTVSLASQPTANVTVAISSSDSGEVSLSTSSLTFTPGNWDVAQVFTVTGVADGIVDGDQTVNVTLTISSQDADYAAIASSDIVVTNQNTDTTPQIQARIFTPDFVVRPHVITASSVQTAILFVAHATGTITVMPIGTASVGETIRTMDGNVQQVSEYVGGVVQATVSAGGMYAIIFEAQTSDRIYSVTSTAGTDAFTQTATTNFLQPTDTNGDSHTTAFDALVVINQLNRESAAEGEFVANASLMDVNRDGKTSALDALIVISELNRRQFAEFESEGEGESADEAAIAVPLQSYVSPSPVQRTTDSEATILNEPEAETLAGNAWAGDPDSQTSLVDDAIRDVFGDNADGEVSDHVESLQLLADDVLDLNWV